ncbi:unnamed protein product [Pleuronectes platessa]|uniref:Uncharacterized protein n=1 Tax=Pleuronectes platessa TaxID=8262 RepID=A0A9N7U2U5_PLEPL|nr:unnamed protein product [Pleuronectes platessa]
MDQQHSKKNRSLTLHSKRGGGEGGGGGGERSSEEEQQRRELSSSSSLSPIVSSHNLPTRSRSQGSLNNVHTHLTSSAESRLQSFGSFPPSRSSLIRSNKVTEHGRERYSFDPWNKEGREGKGESSSKTDRGPLRLDRSIISHAV